MCTDFPFIPVIPLPGPQILRSLRQYFQAWRDEDASRNRSWFEESVVLLSHAFADWRLGSSSQPWRWGMLPEVFSLWRRRVSESGRVPRGYHDMKHDREVQRAAQAVVSAIPKENNKPARQAILALVKRTP